MKSDLVKDLSVLSTLQEGDLKKLVDLSKLAISHDVYEDQLLHSGITDVDVGIGTLSLCVSDEEVSYKFVPSKDFEKMIVDTVLNKTDYLSMTLEEKIYTRIRQAYKDLL